MDKKDNRCLYKSSFASFLDAKPAEVLGLLHQNYYGQLQSTADDAWIGEIQIMQQVLQPWKDEKAEIIFEYDIPRLGRRIDVVLLLRKMIFCLEFKVGKIDALQTDIEQVLDYALDLKNFHLLSHDRTIVPILIPTKYKSMTNLMQSSVYDDSIYNPLITGANGLQDLIQSVILHSGAAEEGYIENWTISPYTPTPTIIEAARTLYENHTVEDITRHEADKVSTDATIAYVIDVIDRSKRLGEKSICFVTGVPGAGKTLIGLDVAVKRSHKSDGSVNDEDGAVYLSGNGPLVAVLTEALARDNVNKCKARNIKKNKSDAEREVKKFIQAVHNYRDNMLAKIVNPVVDGKLEIDAKKTIKTKNDGYAEVEHIAIFDEAQRAWTHERIANYLKRGGTYGNKLKVPNFPMSEAGFLIWSLDLRKDWATIVCLVGGGQEINTGEAGISEWVKAVNEKFPHWKIYISDKLVDPEYTEGGLQELLEQNKENVTYSDKLHLAVSLRSFRAERLSEFVQSLLAFKSNAAELYKNVVDNHYPIVLTRDMASARQWLRQQARGTQKTGILVSKEAARFKPMAVNILSDKDKNAVHWFLEDKTDTRSSDFLEDAATEIQVQGLELDYACVLWDADMRSNGGEWSFWRFNGTTAWKQQQNSETRKYMLNAYRVLLTRARQGLVICIPSGNAKKTKEGFPEDPTRLPEYYDSTYNYLKSLGMKEI